MVLQYFSSFIFLLAFGITKGCDLVCDPGSICFVKPEGTHCNSSELAMMCSDDFCENAGRCQVMAIVDSESAIAVQKMCVCTDGFTGGNCSNTVMCNPECVDGEECKMRNGSASCFSKGGRQILPDPNLIDESVCEPNPCAGDCSCEPSCKHELGYYCVSQEGYIGKNCDIAIPLVTCGETSIDVEISSAFYNEFDKGIGNSFIYVSPSLGNQQCIALETAFNSYQFEIPLPFTDCMTTIDTKNVAGRGISFNNQLWINRGTGGSFDMPVPIVNFTCIYAREYTATTSLQPMIDGNVVIVSRSGHYAVDISLCKQQICQSSCPSYLQVHDSAVYTIGQMIHFNVMVTTKQSLVDSQPNFIATLENLFLSCSADRFDSSAIFTTLAAAGCPSENKMFSFTMSSGISSTPESVCGSIQVPRATGCDKIYIHAEVLLCMASDLQQCNDNSNNFCTVAARKRRSVDNIENQAFVVMGPITIIPGSKGRKIENLFLEGTKNGAVTFQDAVLELPVKPSDFPATPANDLSYYSPIILIVGIVAFALCCTMMLAFVLSRVYRSRVQSTTAKAIELLPPSA